MAAFSNILMQVLHSLNMLQTVQHMRFPILFSSMIDLLTKPHGNSEQSQFCSLSHKKVKALNDKFVLQYKISKLHDGYWKCLL